MTRTQAMTISDLCLESCRSYTSRIVHIHSLILDVTEIVVRPSYHPFAIHALIPTPFAPAPMLKYISVRFSVTLLMSLGRNPRGCSEALADCFPRRLISIVQKKIRSLAVGEVSDVLGRPVT